MVFHRAKIKAAGLPVVMQRNVVECVTKTKFLGVIIDNKLKWNDHITYVKSKISKTIGLFYKMRQYLGRTALVNLYYSLVFPYLIYCNEIWGNASSVHLDPIIKIQKRCVRIITYSDYLLYCIVLYCIMRPYTDGPIGPLSYRHSSGVVRNPHSTLAE